MTDIYKIISDSFPGTSYNSITQVVASLREGVAVRQMMIGLDCGMTIAYRIAKVFAQQNGYDSYFDYRKDFLRKKNHH